MRTPELLMEYGLYNWQEIRSVHLELTSKCNAQCPMCLRTVLGGRINPHLPIGELSLADIQRILPPEFVRQLNRLYMCGNYGDPMMATESLEVMQYLRASNPAIDLEFFTNGSGRTPEWWAELAKTGTQVRFSIDGLEDTNHLYRRGTKWPLIMRSLEAFLAAGGRVEWDYIVFRHNEHQVEVARALAKKMGVAKFNVKRTGRFFSNTKATKKERQEVLNRDGEIEYYLEKPVGAKYLNSAIESEPAIVKEFGSLKQFLGETPIDCKVAKEKSVYVSAEGHVFPCCWTANQLYPWYLEYKAAPIWKMLEALTEGLETLNGKTHSIQEIVEGDFFQGKLPASWNIKGMENGRLFVCAKTCGKGFDAFKAQFEPAVQVGSANAPSQGMSS